MDSPYNQTVACQHPMLYRHLDSGSGLQKSTVTWRARLVYHNRRAYEKIKIEAVREPDDHTPERGIGPSGAQMLNNLHLIQPALPTQSPLRDRLVHLNISGCQLINKSAIDTLLRLSHSHLPNLQRIHMVGL